jgi:hypothetical protein
MGRIPIFLIFLCCRIICVCRPPPPPAGYMPSPIVKLRTAIQRVERPSGGAAPVERTERKTTEKTPRFSIYIFHLHGPAIFVH